MASEQWLAVNIGNSHIHGAVFEGDRLQRVWQVSHTDPAKETLPPPHLEEFTHVLLASVVRSVRTPWHDHPRCRCLSLADVPLKNCYPTIGIDRALGAWGAGITYGFPVLLIDGGTAISLTGIDEQKTLIGGAILPGLFMVARSLCEGTDQLPRVSLPDQPPERWAQNTIGALQSGIFYTILASLISYITDWKNKYPNSPIILTGGSGKYLEQFLRGCHHDPDVIFWGMGQIDRMQ